MVVVGKNRSSSNNNNSNDLVQQLLLPCLQSSSSSNKKSYIVTSFICYFATFLLLLIVFGSTLLFPLLFSHQQQQQQQETSELGVVSPLSVSLRSSKNRMVNNSYNITNKQSLLTTITTPPETKTRKHVKLCDECLKIVQQAEPIDISYVDVRQRTSENDEEEVSQLPPHPHMGGRDVNGNWNYIADETELRNNPPPFDTTNFPFLQGCNNHDSNYIMLTEKVYVDIEYDTMMKQTNQKRPSIFCVVYTIDSSHDRIPYIRETWGPKCDGFIVASNRTDPSINAVDIPHEGEEEYGNIWQKVRSIWSYVYDNYYEKYDWFHIGGDDLFVLVENLRYYLESDEIRIASNGGTVPPPHPEEIESKTATIQTPLFLGRRFAYIGKMNEIFNSGGSGYTINKAALKTLVVRGFPQYFPHLHTFSEDTMVARIFKKFGVVPYETKDEYGGERYMPFLPGHHYTYKIPKSPSAINNDWYAKYSINIKEGLDHCAARSIAFHYVKGPTMKRFYAILYGYCPKV